MDVIERSLFVSRIQSICEEMGAVLRRTAFSSNIKERLDYSCAVFDGGGKLCAQAAHIPVHLGSMAYAMHDIVSRFEWQEGDMIILNDPFLGGTHLPDVTLISPVFSNGSLCAFVTNRAHHADIGAKTPGSMPLSQTLHEEGFLIPPSYIVKNHALLDAVLNNLLQQLHAPKAAYADFSAQMSANTRGVNLLKHLIDKMNVSTFRLAMAELNDYGEKLALAGIRNIPEGIFTFEDVMDDDGMSNTDIKIKAQLHISLNNIKVDFEGTSNQVTGNINCPLSVTAAAVYYCFHCLMPAQTPACAGSFRPIEIVAPEGCLINACRPAAVAAGNVETSTRIVDVVLGALAKAVPDWMPAASHGSMNNIAMGNENWDYYETVGGGMGAGPLWPGLDAVQTHMTNTLNTPIEVLEMRYPVRIKQYKIRRQSGGSGMHKGGDGIVREFEFLENISVTLLTERRRYPPWGLNGGQSAMLGNNKLNGVLLPGKTQLEVKSGDVLTIETAGGGGWG